MKSKVFVLTLFLLAPIATHASVGLSEIMYDPKGTDTKHEWVELYNSGSDAADISKYKLNDGSSSTNHALNAPPANGGTGSLSVPAGGYAILADDATTFLADYPAFSGTVIDSSFSLVDSGATVTLLSCPTSICTTVDAVSYTSDQGGADDGTSLQKNASGIWVAGLPTPGSAYVYTDTPPPGDASPDPTAQSQSSDGSAVSTDASAGTVTATNAASDEQDTTTVTASGGTAAGTASVPASRVAVAVPMQASLTVTRSIAAGATIAVAPSVTGTSGQLLRGGLFRVALGDGGEHVSELPEPFSYLYKYPGTYVMQLRYWSDPYTSAPPDVSVRMVVTVLAPSVSASVNADGSVTLANTGTQEADLSGWNLRSLSAMTAMPFVVPDGTILLPGRSMTLDSGMTRLSANQTASLALAYPSGAVASLAIGQEPASPAAAASAETVLAAADTGNSIPAAVADASNPVNMSAPASSASQTVPRKQRPSAKLSAVATALAAPEPAAQAAPEFPALASGTSLAAAAAGALGTATTDTPGALWPFIVGLAGVVAGALLAVRRFRVFSGFGEAFSMTPNATPLADAADGPSRADSAAQIRIIDEEAGAPDR